MKKQEIQIGKVYLVKVSGVLAQCRVDAEKERRMGPLSGQQHRTAWVCTNLKTKRQITVRSAQRFRKEVVAEATPAKAPDTQPVPRQSSLKERMLRVAEDLTDYDNETWDQSAGRMPIAQDLADYANDGRRHPLTVEQMLAALEAMLLGVSVNDNLYDRLLELMRIEREGMKSAYEKEARMAQDGPSDERCSATCDECPSAATACSPDEDPPTDPMDDLYRANIDGHKKPSANLYKVRYTGVRNGDKVTSVLMRVRATDPYEAADNARRILTNAGLKKVKVTEVNRAMRDAKEKALATSTDDVPSEYETDPMGAWHGHNE